MDPLGRHFVSDVAQSAARPAESAAYSFVQSLKELSYDDSLERAAGSAPGAGADAVIHAQTDALSDALPDGMRAVNTLSVDELLVKFPSRALGNCADALAFLVLAAMLYRTYSYVKQRRNGRAGPAMAPILIKFWATYGVVEFGLYVLSLYLMPFGGSWLASVLRALVLSVLTWGRRLPFAVKLYDMKLVPFYDSQAPEIEKMFSQARETWDELNDAFRELAKHLLKRIAVGGLSGAVSGTDSGTKEGEDDEQQESDGNGRQQRRRGPSLPADTRTFSSDRQFFAGEAAQRAETVANASMDAMRGVIRSAASEPPKAAYEDSRALRQQFRKRKKSGLQLKGSKE